MKNASKRTKSILAIVGIVVVVVIAVGVVFTQTPVGELFGTTALVITPSNPTITVGDSIGLSVNATCSWSSSNTAVVSFVGNTTPVTSVTVKGNAAGSATIVATCKTFTVKATTTVTVNPAPSLSPAKLSLPMGASGTLTILNPPTGGMIGESWTSSNESVATIIGRSGNTLTISGVRAGQATITVNWSTGASASSVVTVIPPTATPTRTATPPPTPTRTPAPPTITPHITGMQPDTTMTFSTGDATCTWTASGGAVIGSNVGATITFKSISLSDRSIVIQGYVRADCAGGSDYMPIMVAYGMRPPN